jgi:hypothetical protein
MALATCVAPDATVRDEGHTLTGWPPSRRGRSRRRGEYTVEPLEGVQQDSKTVVTARVSGNFPGSPVTLAYIFELDRDTITSLEIRS